MGTDTASAATDSPVRTDPWAVAVGATAVLAVVLGVFGSIGVLIDPLAAEFDAPRSHLVLLFAAALSVHSVAARPAGRVLDRRGPRPLLLVAAAGMAFGPLATAAAGSTWVAVGGYGLGLGLASASTWVATTAVVTAAFERRRAAALGLLSAGPAAGGAVLAPVMAALAEARGPRFACVVVAVLGVLACGAGAAVVRDHRPGGRPPAGDGGPAPRAPMRGLRPFLAANLLMSLVVFLPLVHLAGYAADLGLSPAQGAGLLAVVSAVSATTRLGTGWLATPRTLPWLYLVSHGLVAAAFATWALAGRPTALPVLTGAAALFGAGYGAWLSLGPAMLAATSDPRHLGRALGTFASVVGAGGVIGPVLAAPLLGTVPVVALAGCAVVALGAAAVSCTIAMGADGSDPCVTRTTALGEWACRRAVPARRVTSGTAASWRYRRGHVPGVPRPQAQALRRPREAEHPPNSDGGERTRRHIGSSHVRVDRVRPRVRVPRAAAVVRPVDPARAGRFAESGRGRRSP